MSSQHSATISTSSTQGFDLQVALQSGLSHHQAGRLAEAERLYRQVLAQDARNADALHFLGLLAHQIGRHAQAAELVEQSIRIDASDPNVHNNLGDIYRALSRYDDALASFQKALALSPDVHQIRNNLGETYRMMGKLNDAKNCFQQVLKISPEYAVAHNNLGLTLQALGALDASVASLRQALVLNPAYWKAHNNLGESLRKLGRADEAVKCYQAALSFHADFHEAHNNLGLILHHQGKLTDAQASFEKAHTLAPDVPEVLNNLGMVLKDQGAIDRALTCFDRAINLRAEYAEAHGNLAILCKEKGYTAKALSSCQAAIKIKPEENGYWILFAEIARLLPEQAFDQIHLPTLLMALKQDQVDAQHLERIASSLVVQSLPEHVAQQDAEFWRSLQQDQRFILFIEMPLLLATLEETIIADHRLELFLTRCRRVMLNAVAGEMLEVFLPSMARFAAALALQCFANEYIYAVDAEEEAAHALLLDKISSLLDRGQPIPDVWLLLAAAYQALYRMPFAEKISIETRQDEYVNVVVARQLAEPRREESIKQTLLPLTSVDNTVSVAVRQQYEESPYPRWRKFGKSNGRPRHVVMQSLFPQHEIFPTSPAHLDVLVAGCGTGYHSIRAAQRFDSADVLAVDLSLSSLAYAKRVTEQHGIDNIDYRQADILQLGAIDRQFDVIECCGVLHHMADPMAGWQVLVNLLRPDGAMFVGLYSARARRQVSALRELISAGGYEATADGIRRFRADALSGEHGISIGDLARSPDFNSSSACRDLLFHVQEHVFTPLQIQSCLQQLRLKFLGFEIPYPEVKRNYLARFPDNDACDNLSNWELFEEDNPHVFGGMYQFWVMKDDFVQ